MKQIIATILWAFILSFLLVLLAYIACLVCGFLMGAEASRLAYKLGVVVRICFFPMTILFTAWIGVTGFLPWTKINKTEPEHAQVQEQRAKID